jgi:hypothetical protein
MGLADLPESLGQFTQLQSLNLSHNQLTALPESLGQLTQLHSLNLSDNQLTGSQGQDWFFANRVADSGGAIDRVLDLAANELWNDTDF